MYMAAHPIHVTLGSSQFIKIGNTVLKPSATEHIITEAICITHIFSHLTSWPNA